MSKKIVILALHLGTGGTERVISNLANLLVENNEVKIISTYKLKNTPAFKLDSKINIEYLLKDLTPNKKELKHSLKTFNLISFFVESLKSLKILYLRKSLMIKAIKNLDCDIIISTRVMHNNWVSKYANKSTLKIAQEHNHHNNNKKQINKVVKSVRNFDYFMPASKELSDFYKDKVQRTKVIYIPNFIEELPKMKSNLKNKQLISVGRLDKIKGFSDLIDLFNIFQKDHNDWRLHIVGDGSEKENLQNKINSLNLGEKIILCGNKTSKELEKEYLNSTVYLMTSLSESFGLVLVEAASFGLPLIAFDSAQGAKEIIENEKNGYLIPNRDKCLFLEKLNEIIDNSEKIQDLSKNSIITAEKFSKNNISKMWKEFINNL
ncbi:MAG: glycosyltransferase family 4 protein [Clostridia bacterium]|nr:glycosyltransferase family 4 protein [Clostridia bacterium]